MDLVGVVMVPMWQWALVGRENGAVLGHRCARRPHLVADRDGVTCLFACALRPEFVVQSTAVHEYFTR
jgi:hypothetical protein